MATRNILKLIDVQIKVLLNKGVPLRTIGEIQRERRNMVESEICRYNCSKRTIEALQERINRENNKLCQTSSPVLSDMPKGPPNPDATTNKLVESIDKIITWERRIHQEEGMNERFERVFESLSDIEKNTVTLTYGLNNSEVLDPEEIVERVGYSRSHTFRIRTQAMDILALQLFGSISVTHPFTDLET